LGKISALLDFILITTTLEKAASFDHKYIKKPFSLEYLLTVINEYKRGFKVPLVSFKDYMAETKTQQLYVFTPVTLSVFW